MMYGGYPGGYTPPPPAGDTFQLRMKQIDSLRQFNPSVREVERGVAYDVQFALPPNSRPAVLRVNLPPTFPSSGPYIILIPQMRHALLHPATGQVLPTAHENLRGWGLHCILGKVVSEVIQKFVADPPMDTGAGAYPPVPVASQPPRQGYPGGAVSSYLPPSAIPTSIPGAAPASSASPPAARQPPPPPPPVPAIPTPQVQKVDPASVALPDMETLSLEELETLLTDEAKFEELFGAISAVRESVRVRDELREGVAKLAQANTAAAARAETLQRDVDAKREEAAAARAKAEEAQRRRQELERESSPAALVQKLAEAARSAEAETDAIAERFVAGEIPAAEFVRLYRERRAVFHQRSAKRESLANTFSL